MYQTPSARWASIIPDIDRVLANINGPMIDRPIAISQLTICADERSAPSNEYVELEPHPASTRPSTPTDETASMNRSPMFTLAIVAQVAPHGMTARTTNAATTDTIGAMIKTALSALSGMMSSLSNSFNPSAAG